MRRSVLFLNLLLAAAIGLAGWQMRRQYVEQLNRQREFLARKVTPPPPPVLLLPPEAPPLQASAYLEVAAVLPFSPDRNPTVIVEIAPPKPMPALPGYHGMMNFGQGPRVILSTAGSPQRSYQVGDVIGDFKLVAVTGSGLVFEWDGKQVPASYADLLQRRSEAGAAQSGPVAAAPGPPPAASAPASSVVTISGGPAPAGGGPLGESVDSQGNRECRPGDTTPEGTIVNGYKKVTIRSPFGAYCRWVPAAGR